MRGKGKRYENGSQAGIRPWSFDPDEIVIVGLDVQVTDENEHLQCNRATEEPSEEMIQSIMDGGVRQAVEITKIDEKPHLVFGRKRTLAAREAKKRLAAKGIHDVIRVPCLDKKDDKLELAIDVIVENEIREQDNPVNQAKKMKRLKRLGATNQRIATAFGCSTESVRQKLKLLELDEPVQEMVGKDLPVEAANELANLPVKEQLLAAKKVAKAPKGEKKVAAKKAVGKNAVKRPSNKFIKAVATYAPLEGVERGAVAAMQWAAGMIDEDELKQRKCFKLLKAIQSAKKAPAKKR